MEPVEERGVELGERVVVDDVFGDAAEEPKPGEADQQSQREVEAEVPARRKPRGDKVPRRRMTLLEPLESR